MNPELTCECPEALNEMGDACPECRAAYDAHLVEAIEAAQEAAEASWEG